MRDHSRADLIYEAFAILATNGRAADAELSPNNAGCLTFLLLFYGILLCFSFFFEKE